MPLNRLYSRWRAARIARQLRRSGLDNDCPRLPVLYVPGILGTCLYDTRARLNIWGDPRALLFPGPEHAGYALPTEPETPSQRQRVIAAETLHAFSIIPGLLDTLITRELCDVLRTALGYSVQRDLIFVGHDWRRDYRELAPRLDAEMERLQSLYGEGCKVALIGQSVANPALRYWLRATSAENRQRIARWYAFGPPWRGSYHALTMMHKGYYPAGKRFRGFSPEDIQSCPSGYQLLPQQPRVIDALGEPVSDFSFYDPQCWREYRLGPWHPDAATTGRDDGQCLRRLSPLLQGAQAFCREALASDPAIDAISQLWFLGDGNRAVYAAVHSPRGFLCDHKDILHYTPQLADKAFAPGDEHLPLQDFVARAVGPFVRDPLHAPFGESYQFVGKPRDHRAIINYTPNLQLLAFDLAITSQQHYHL